MKLTSAFLVAAGLFASSSSTVLASPSPASADSSIKEESTLVKRAGRLIENCTKAKTFALTFDDGPYVYGKDISRQILAKKGKATYFINGNNYGCVYDPENAADLLARYQAGHLIASHTWGHTDITTLTTAQLNKQLDLVEEAMGKILGVKPRYFRPPYGSYDQKSLNVLYSRGYDVILWSADSGDSVGASPSESMATYDQIIARGKPALVLNHEPERSTNKQVMPYVLPKIKAKYSMVTVAQCIGDNNPYAKVGNGKPGKRDSSWTCAGKPGPGEA